MKKKKQKNLRPDMVEDNMGVNPFTASLKVNLRTVKGVYYDDGIMAESIVQLEVNTYAKVFDSAEHRIAIMNLSYRALQTWTWIMYSIDSGKDYIWMNVPRVMQECSIKSIKTYKAAIEELCRYGHIAPCVGLKNVYWINPSIAFKGSRARKYPDNVVRKKINE